MTLMILGVFLATFVAVAAAVLSAKGRFSTAEPTAPQTVPNGEEERPFDWLTPVIAPALLREEALSSISVVDRILAKVDGMHLMKSRIAEAGLKWSVGRLTFMMLLAGAATFAILWKMNWVPPYVALAAAVGASFLPYLAVLRRRSRRLLKFEEQFPDAIDSLARSLRSGNALAGAIELLARETPQPLGGEFRRLVDERNLGLNWEVALLHLVQRVPIIEVSVFAAAVQLQTRTGGKLHEVLGKLAENMREASALKGEVRSIAAHGKLTGNILTALPVLIAVMMAYVNPSSLYLLWNDSIGHHLIWIAIALLILAHFVIGRLVDIKI